MLWRRSFLGGAPFVPKVFKHRLGDLIFFKIIQEINSYRSNEGTGYSCYPSRVPTTWVRQNPRLFSMPLGSISLKHFVLWFRRCVFPDPCCLFLILVIQSSLQNQSEGGDKRSNKNTDQLRLCLAGQAASPERAEEGCVSWDLWS